MAEMSGGEALARSLANEGVNYIFGLSGTEVLDTLEVVDRTPGMRLILTRNEQSASYMAMAYARASKSPGACISTLGPGAANLVPGVAAAFKGYAPVLALTGKPERGKLEKDPHQDIDSVSLYRPITKWSSTPATTKAIPEVVHKAIRIATGGLPGPVHLAVPSDMQREKADVELLPAQDYRPDQDMTYSSARGGGASAKIVAALDIIQQARSPVILVGWEALWEGCVPKIIELAEVLSIPVATTSDTPDAFPTVHPLGVGPVGGAAWDIANQVVSHADAVLALGVKFDWKSTLFSDRIVSSKQQIVHVSRHWENIGALYPVKLGIVDSVASFLEGAVQEAKERRWPVAWPNLSSLKEKWESQRRSQAPASSPINVPYATRVLRKLLKKDSIIVCDGGNIGIHLKRHLDYYQPDTYFYPLHFGAVGAGYPMALGVKAARPHQDVICVAGDASFMLSIGELETAIRENLKVTSVILNDAGLGAERAEELKNWPGRKFFATDYTDSDFGKIAQAFGAWGVRITEPGDLEGALEAALAADGPSVVDVVINKEYLAPTIG